MTPLSAVLEEACSKMKPALAPGEHALACGKPLKPVDLSLPFRLANIPSGSRLELVRSAAAAPAAAPMARAAPQATAPSHSTGGAAAQAAGASDADAGPSNSGGGAGAAATPEVASAREAPAAPAPAAAAEPAAPHGGEAAMKSVEGLDRQVAVFSRAAVEAAAAASGAPAGANVDGAYFGISVLARAGPFVQLHVALTAAFLWRWLALHTAQIYNVIVHTWACCLASAQGLNCAVALAS